MNMNSIGRHIRQFRKDKKIMQEALAERAGLSTNYISMIERGEKIPSLSSLIKIANALSVTADMLLCDVIDSSYSVKTSLIMDKVSGLSKSEQERIIAVIETLIAHAEK